MRGKDAQRTRSPLKRKPLHNPGESLEQEIHRVLDEEVVPYIAVAILAFCFAAYEWVRAYLALPPQPIALTLVALAFGAFAGIKVVHHWRRLRDWRLGLEGEKAVGQYLEDLRRQDCRVFHDLLGDGFNIDHVVIGPQGIFTVETKTYSKPLRGRVSVVVDGEQLRVNGHVPERNPISQALAARQWLSEFLQECTGRLFPVKAVVLLPGWFVESHPAQKREGLWVLNPKALPAFLEQEPRVLQPEDIALAASRLIDHITRA